MPAEQDCVNRPHARAERRNRDPNGYEQDAAPRMIGAGDKNEQLKDRGECAGDRGPQSENQENPGDSGKQRYGWFVRRGAGDGGDSIMQEHGPGSQPEDQKPSAGPAIREHGE